MRTGHHRLRLVLGAVALVCANLTQASVVMTGTRVIYPANLKEQTLQFHNPDAHPNVVQVWLDDGDRQASPDEAKTPFLVLPQVFRVEPQAGQMVRLMMADASSLPQDRESVFYLNFTQLPARKKTDAPANELLLMFTSRVKVFYRPARIDANLPAKITEQLQLAWRDGALHVHNPTAYHVVVRQAELVTGADVSTRLEQAQGDMIAPFSEAVWRYPGTSVPSLQNTRLRLILVNDFGADVTAELRLP